MNRLKMLFLTDFLFNLYSILFFGLFCLYWTVGGREETMGEKEMGLTCNKGPLPDLNQGCCMHLATTMLLWLTF